MINKANSGYNM